MQKYRFKAEFVEHEQLLSEFTVWQSKVGLTVFE